MTSLLKIKSKLNHLKFLSRMYTPWSNAFETLVLFKFPVSEKFELVCLFTISTVGSTVRHCVEDSKRWENTGESIKLSGKGMY